MSTLSAARAEARAHPFVILVVAVAAAAAALGAAAIQRGQIRDNSSGVAALTIVAGLSFVGAGLLAETRRPERWTGALMVGAGFILFANALVGATQSLPFTIALIVGPLPNAVLAHLVLGFPDGRLHSSVERLLVGAAYLNATVVQIVMLMFMGLEHVGGCPCPSNLLLVRDDMAVHSALMSVEQFAGVGIAVAVAVLLIERWRSASSSLRRALAPILITGAVTIVLQGAAWVAATASLTDLSAGMQSAGLLALATVPLAYFVGLFRGRLARLGVSDLVVELGRGLEPGRLHDALARTLRDPSLELGYWIPESHQYVNAAGHRVDVDATDTRAVTILESHGHNVAALVHDAALSEDPALLEAVSSAAGLALENERLLAELRVQLNEIRDSRARIVDAADSERRRLERNLHDGAQQRLVTLSIQLRMAQECLHDNPPSAAVMLAGVGEDLKLALEELRELARGLHPAVLTDRGLAPALQSLANRAPFTVEIIGIPSLRLSQALEAAVYYVVAESLTNAAKHSGASEACVEMSTTSHVLVVEIRDNGSGGASLGGGSGMRGLADRIEALGGQFEVQSPAGVGTVIRARLPLG